MCAKEHMKVFHLCEAIFVSACSLSQQGSNLFTCIELKKIYSQANIYQPLEACIFWFHLKNQPNCMYPLYVEAWYWLHPMRKHAQTFALWRFKYTHQWFCLVSCFDSSNLHRWLATDSSRLVHRRKTGCFLLLNWTIYRLRVDVALAVVWINIFLKLVRKPSRSRQIQNVQRLSRTCNLLLLVCVSWLSDCHSCSKFGTRQFSSLWRFCWRSSVSVLTCL